MYCKFVQHKLCLFTNAVRYKNITVYLFRCSYKRSHHWFGWTTTSESLLKNTGTLTTGGKHGHTKNQLWVQSYNSPLLAVYVGTAQSATERDRRHI